MSIPQNSPSDGLLQPKLLQPAGLHDGRQLPLQSPKVNVSIPRGVKSTVAQIISRRFHLIDESLRLPRRDGQPLISRQTEQVSKTLPKPGFVTPVAELPAQPGAVVRVLNRFIDRREPVAVQSRIID